jgi:hypothetical protein
MNLFGPPLIWQMETSKLAHRPRRKQPPAAALTQNLPLAIRENFALTQLKFELVVSSAGGIIISYQVLRQRQRTHKHTMAPPQDTGPTRKSLPNHPRALITRETFDRAHKLASGHCSSSEKSRRSQAARIAARSAALRHGLRGIDAATLGQRARPQVGAWRRRRAIGTTHMKRIGMICQRARAICRLLIDAGGRLEFSV